MIKKKMNRFRQKAANLLHRIAERMRFDANFPFGNPNIELLRYHRDFMFSHKFETVLDIGANVGQSAKKYRALFPNAMIYSFEPLPDCYAQMETAMVGDSRFRAFEMALGDESGTRTFYRSSFAQSSSFLPMADLHKRVAPYSAGSEPCTVRIERLDDLADQLELRPNMLVKIDVQGFEDAVLRGGEKTIRMAQMLILEVSFSELYHGQVLFADLVKMLDTWGFKILNLRPAGRDHVTKSMLWADCAFVADGTSGAARS